MFFLLLSVVSTAFAIVNQPCYQLPSYVGNITTLSVDDLENIFYQNNVNVVNDQYDVYKL